ncbi:hypothetical protein NMY22_g18231 [Coprinellus aureogranulatus]|nr:hypothetical protein NMY22_g18231 [Coprinellus aureogranulatus]
MSADEAPELLKKRFQIINLWRPISHTALDWPLALCDYYSVDVKQDTQPITLAYPDRNGEVYGIKYNPNFQWKYLRGMTPDEAILIKCYDSIQDGSVAVFTPHTAFADPTTPPDAPLRQSIELRALFSWRKSASPSLLWQGFVLLAVQFYPRRSHVNSIKGSSWVWQLSFQLYRLSSIYIQGLRTPQTESYPLKPNEMSIDGSPPSTVTAKLGYYTPPVDGSPPTITVADLKRNYSITRYEVTIEDVRGKEDQYTLDTSGFQWVHTPAKHTSFQNDEAIKNEYYPESIDLLKKVTGASRVVIFDHTLRRRRPDWNGDDTIQALQPAAEVHGDQTPNGATNRVHLHMSAEEAPELLKKRFQIINIWRPISHPALDWPLALCDYRSVDVEKDALPVTLVRPDRNGEIYGFSYNPDHQWKYVRGMTPDEVVLIKCQDSVRDGSVAVFTPHCAFVDPTTPRDTPPRESIEMRALVFYD